MNTATRQEINIADQWVGKHLKNGKLYLVTAAGPYVDTKGVTRVATFELRNGVAYGPSRAMRPEILERVT